MRRFSIVYMAAVLLLVTIVGAERAAAIGFTVGKTYTVGSNRPG